MKWPLEFQRVGHLRQPIKKLKQLSSGVSIGLQGSCVLFLDPDRFDLVVGGRRLLFSYLRT